VQCYGVAGLTCLTPCPIEGVATYPFIEKPGRTGPFDRLRYNHSRRAVKVAGSHLR